MLQNIKLLTEEIHLKENELNNANLYQSDLLRLWKERKLTLTHSLQNWKLLWKILKIRKVIILSFLKNKIKLLRSLVYELESKLMEILPSKEDEIRELNLTAVGWAEENQLIAEEFERFKVKAGENFKEKVGEMLQKENTLIGEISTLHLKLENESDIVSNRNCQLLEKHEEVEVLLKELSLSVEKCQKKEKLIEDMNHELIDMKADVVSITSDSQNKGEQIEELLVVKG